MVRLIAEQIPEVIVDWQQGDEWVAAELERLIATKAPEVILLSHRSMFGNVAHIVMPVGDKSINFFVGPNGAIGLKSASADLVRKAAIRLSSAIGYDWRLSEPNPGQS